MDGLWSTGNDRREVIQQAKFNRFRLLRVNTAAKGASDMSGSAGLDPTVAPLATTPGAEGGPHFILAPETGDGQLTQGFEFGLISPSDPPAGAATGATPGAGGFTITIWRLVDTAQQAGISTLSKSWLAMQPLTGADYKQLFRSFDMNTGAIRFQIGNVAIAGAIVLAFCEL
jgi:hypothetical protein